MLNSKNYFTPYAVDLSNMSSATIDSFDKRIEALPKNIRDAIDDFAMAEFIEDVLGEKFGLTADQKIELTRIVRDILMGDILLSDALRMVSQKLTVPADVARDICNGLLAGPLAPTIEDLKTLNKKQPQSSPPSPPPPTMPSGQINPNNVVDLRNQNK